MADVSAYSGFVGRYVNRVDSKGRVSVPARFRAHFGKDEAPICLPSLNEPALEVGGDAMMETIRDTVDRHAAHSKERIQLSAVFYGRAMELKFDEGGRVLLPEEFRAHADLKDEAAFVGMGDRFHIWAPGDLARYLEKAEAQARSLLDALPSSRRESL